MDNFNEKKWFVYLSDHHEGPFSLNEIQNRLSSGVFTSMLYVWVEGMSDWKPMTEVAAFQAILPKPPAHPSVAPPAIKESYAVFENPSEPSLHPPAPVTPPNDAEAIPVVAEEITQTLIPESDLPASSPEEPRSPKRKTGWLKWVLRFIVLICFFGIVAFFGLAYREGYFKVFTSHQAVQAVVQTAKNAAKPYLFKAVGKYPSLGKWISPLPPLEDVSREEYEELRSAALADLNREGPRFALALSRTDLSAPLFYIATNLPDGIQFEIHVEGIPDTLLGQMSLSNRTRATVSQKLARTGIVRQADGKGLPRGDYVVFIAEPTDSADSTREWLSKIPTSTIKGSITSPKESRVLGQKTYFLGGTKDESYTSRLGEYHLRLKEKADAEIAEVKQFAATLESQLNDTIARFAALGGTQGKVTPIRKSAWNEFHKKWEELTQQLTQTFKQWTLDQIQNEFFHGVLYRMTQQAGQTVEDVHLFHHAYYTSKVNPAGFDIQLGQVTSSALSAVTALRAKIEQIEKIQPAQGGMPRKEGQ